MVKSKLITVLDEGTNALFLVTKYEKSDEELLAKKGWKFSDELSIISLISDKICSSMSSFEHPPYDIRERTRMMDYDHTTHAVANIIRDSNFDDIPDVVDVTNVVLNYLH